MSCNLRQVCHSTRHFPRCDEFQQVPPSDPVYAMCLVVKYVGPDSENIVVIEALSVFRSKFSISCPANFRSPLWNYPAKGSSTCSFAPFSPNPEMRSSPRIGVLRCFASAIFFLKESHSQANCFLLSATSHSTFRERRWVSHLHCPVETSIAWSHHLSTSRNKSRGQHDSVMSCLLIRREKIIVHPAEEIVQGPLFHLKWSAQ